MVINQKIINTVSKFMKIPPHKLNSAVKMAQSKSDGVDTFEQAKSVISNLGIDVSLLSNKLNSPKAKMAGNMVAQMLGYDYNTFMSALKDLQGVKTTKPYNKHDIPIKSVTNVPKRSNKPSSNLLSQLDDL